MRRTPLLSLVALGLTLGACADDAGIVREATPAGDDAQQGMAINLDAKQRVVVVGRTGVYCGEPGPDTMAAYAQAFAAGIAVPSQGTGAEVGALQANAASSIGLRTQSITLMRDALYRLCEASANGQISDFDRDQIMARSQDLTAAIITGEHLTGPGVAANVSADKVGEVVQSLVDAAYAGKITITQDGEAKTWTVTAE